MAFRLQEKVVLSADEPTYRFSRYLKQRFPWRTFKVTLHAGFSCPNIDGTVARGGCSYCDNRTFSPQLTLGGSSVRQQMRVGQAKMRKLNKAEKFIAYFQSFTNTHGPIEQLRAVYDQALAEPDVVALAVGTRPDCVPDPVLDLLAEYAELREVWVEYGMQSAHDQSAVLTNRHQTMAQFVDALQRTALRPSLKVCVHVILGLPGETHEMMLQTADALAALPYHSIKIHHLYISAGTPMADAFAAGKVQVLSLDRYVPLVADFLERISPEVSIQRMMGELNHPSVIAPQWGLTKGEIEDLILEELRRRGRTQGSLHRTLACAEKLS